MAVYQKKYSLNKLMSRTSLFMITCTMGVSSFQALGKDYFNLNALSHVDDFNIADLANLEQFSLSGNQLPGEYNVNIILNDSEIGVSSIDFVLNDEHQLVPVLTKQMLDDWGVNSEAVPTLRNLPDDAKLIGIANYIEFATTQFLFAKQVLKISIPQIALKTDIRGSIDPALFDQGISAITLNYDFNGARSWHDNRGPQDNKFLSLRSGVNLGAWRVRNYSTYQRSEKVTKWNSIQTYASRDIQSIKSQLVLGEATTAGDIFSGFQFTGIKLTSDESMLPYSLRGFAPVVRGFAQTNAKVTVRQNGSIIYQTYVAPGPFELTDLYPTSFSGNLDVSVEEENGSEQSFVVPFSSLAIMQREGGIRYSATIGQYRPVDTGKKPNFLEGSLIYGLPWDTTLYGGSILSRDYQSYALGIGFNLGNLGAISFDSKHAFTTFDFVENKQRGQAYRLQYSKTVQNTNSTIALEAYKYSSRGFYDFAEANEKTYTNFNTDLNRRSRYQINFSQSLAQYGSFYISAYQQDYWRTKEKKRNLSAGYNLVINNISYGLSYGYIDSKLNNSHSHQVSFRLNIPLGAWLSTNNYLTSSISYAGHGKASVQGGISGNALNNNLMYSVQQSYEKQNHYTGGNATIGYQGSSGFANLGYAYTKNSERLDYGVQGGIVIHPYGVTLSQSLNDTIALVIAPGASNVALQNTQGVETNAFGHAVKPYITPYTENKIILNIDHLGDDVDIINNNRTVIPTKGAVTLAKFDTHIGYRVLFTLNLHGKPLPFGTIVTLTDSQSQSSGIVGDNGEVYLSGMPEQGNITAQWGKDTAQMCKADYQLPSDILHQSIKLMTIECTQ